MIKFETEFVYLRNETPKNTQLLYNIYDYIEQLENKVSRRNMQIKELKKKLNNLQKTTISAILEETSSLTKSGKKHGSKISGA